MTAVSPWRHAFCDFSPGSLADVRAFFAPGRVNLIGEHVDYSGGYVLPAALELGTWLMVRPRRDGKYRFQSGAFSGTCEIMHGDVAFRSEHGFANYPKGVVSVLGDHGIRCTGGDFFYHSNLPVGAGLSSSAAIEVVTAKAIASLAEVEVAHVDLARYAQAVENDYLGVQCGIMDQFAVAMGRQDAAILLHCKDLAFEHVPLDLGEYTLVIANSNKSRTLAESKYNERRRECDTALAQIQSVLPDLAYLTDLTPNQWSAVKQVVTDATQVRRVDHVVSETQRVLRAATELRQGNIQAVGALLNESHASLRDDYEVSGRELDALAEAAWHAAGCVGSRMTGAGFGGCTVSIVHHTALEAFTADVTSTYEAATGLRPAFYPSRPGGGVRELLGEERMTWLSL